MLNSFMQKKKLFALFIHEKYINKIEKEKRIIYKKAKRQHQQQHRLKNLEMSMYSKKYRAHGRFR